MEEAITPKEIFIDIKKDIKSEQGNNYTLKINYKEDKFCIYLEKKGIIFSDIFSNKYTISQIQENNYFKLFSSPQELLEEFKDRIESKTPVVNECQNNFIILTIFLPTSKYKKIEFNLIQDKNNINLNSQELKSVFEKMQIEFEELKKENKKIIEENKEIKEENKRILEENKEIKEEIKRILEENKGIKEHNIQIEKKMEEIENKIKNKSALKKNNFRWINKEVNIVNNSKFDEDFTPDIMLGNKRYEYALTAGNRNHFVEFSFNKLYYLKSLRIKVTKDECSLKTFKVEIISSNDNRNIIGEFIRNRRYSNQDEEYQEFAIDRECKGIKLYLIDNWGMGGGNYILISKIDFYVSD